MATQSLTTAVEVISIDNGICSHVNLNFGGYQDIMFGCLQMTEYVNGREAL